MHRVGVAWLVVFVAACAYDRGPFYEQPAEPPLTPYTAALRVFGDDEACVACVERECHADVDACVDDDACGDHALCRAACDDPICRLACDDAYPYGERPDAVLERCAIDACAEPCPVGRDWSCVSEYPRPVLESTARFPWKLQLLPGLVADATGLLARACATIDSACEDPIDQVELDAQGHATLELPPDTVPPGTFTGYVELSDPTTPPRIATTLLFASAGFLPNTDTHPGLYPTMTPGFIELITARHGRSEALQSGLAGQVWDCRFSPFALGTSATVEVSTADGDTTYSYGLLTARSDQTAADGAFSTAGIAPGFVDVTVEYGGATVAKMSAHVRADAFTHVWLFPTTIN